MPDSSADAGKGLTFVDVEVVLVVGTTDGSWDLFGEGLPPTENIGDYYSHVACGQRHFSHFGH